MSTLVECGGCAPPVVVDAAPVELLAEIGRLAIAQVNARKACLAARRTRNQRVKEWHEENEERYDPLRDCLLPEFVQFTADVQAAYKAATRESVNATRRLRVAVERCGGAS